MKFWPYWDILNYHSHQYRKNFHPDLFIAGKAKNQK